MVLLLFGAAISGMKAQTMYVRPITGTQSAYSVGWNEFANAENSVLEV